MLFVITNPPSAEIVIKNNQGETVKQSRANDGELRAELPAGAYLVQVTSSDLAPFSSKVILRPGGIRVVTADLKFNSGSIVIGPIEPDAIIFINGEKVAEWKRNENMAEIEDVLPGKHLLRIMHPNIAAYEKEIVISGLKRHNRYAKIRACSCRTPAQIRTPARLSISTGCFMAKSWVTGP